MNMVELFLIYMLFIGSVVGLGFLAIRLGILKSPEKQRSLSQREIAQAVKAMPLSSVNKLMAEISCHFKEYWATRNAQFVYQDDDQYVIFAPLADGGISIRQVDGKLIKQWLYDEGKQEHHDFWVLPIELYRKLLTTPIA